MILQWGHGYLNSPITLPVAYLNSYAVMACPADIDNWIPVITKIREIYNSQFLMRGVQAQQCVRWDGAFCWYSVGY